MGNILPLITVIIPCRNEEYYIKNTLRTVIDNDYPKDKIEVFVIDGMSTDNTQIIVEKITKEYSFIRLLLNPDKTVPYALNMAIKKSKGDLILRLDVHSEYPLDYIQNCISAMNETDADCVGGILITNQNGNSLSAKIVQMITTHWFGVGNSSFRLKPDPHYADTVPFGFFKKTIFDKIGLFDERLTRNQDYEFNQRILKTGRKIWLDPAIWVYYKNQATMWGLLKQAFGTGKWNVWMWRVAPYSFKIRHVIPGIFVLCLFGAILISSFISLIKYFLLLMLSVYSFFSIFASIQQSIIYRMPLTISFLPFCFFLYHISYGFGIITGILSLIMGRSEVGKNTRPWNGASDYYAIQSI